MKTEIFTLCDSAMDYLGKTVIVGTFNDLKAVSFPVSIQNISLVIRLSFEQNESFEQQMSLKAYNVDDPELQIFVFNSPFSVAAQKEKRRSFLNLNLKLDGIHIPKQGTYRFEIKIGDWQDSIELYAAKIVN